MFIPRSTLKLLAIAGVYTIVSVTAQTAVAVTTMPDFYSEPTKNPFRQSESDTANVQVDLSSGALSVSHIDLVVPGNGGLDIRIQRVYNSSKIYKSSSSSFTPSQLNQRGFMGIGWTMHFGRVSHKPADSNGTTVHLCDTSPPSPVDQYGNPIPLNNPVLELGDGSDQILFVHRDQSFATFITKRQWVADCVNGPGAGEQSLIVTSPSGTKYTMDHKVSYGSGVDQIDYYYTSKIEDRHSNSLTINYDPTIVYFGNPAITSVTSSDGRNVTFSYTQAVSTDPNSKLLTSINSNAGAVWHYKYVLADGQPSSTDQYQLDKVYVDNTEFTSSSPLWNYGYKLQGTIGQWALNKITYPYGGTTSLDYNWVDFYGNTIVDPTLKDYALAVTNKDTSGIGVSTGNWTYQYTPGNSEDQTTVTYPGGHDVYHHFGFQSEFKQAGGLNNNLFRVGSLKKKETYQGTGSGNKVREETYTWAKYPVSNQAYYRKPLEDPRNALPQYDDATYIPVVTNKTVAVTDYGGGAGATTTYTTVYSDINESDGYQPRTIVETGDSNVVRTTHRTFYNRLAGQNMVGLVEDQWLGNASWTSTPVNRRIDRTFNSNADLQTENKYGVNTSYTYFSSGDVNTITDANNHTQTFSNYYRGVPKNETNAIGEMVSRLVSSDGTISQFTNGRGKVTKYYYGPLNRVTRIELPKTGSAPIYVNYSIGARTLSRGNYTQSINYDGFHRPLCVISQDLAGDSIVQTEQYDALGRKIFSSYPAYGSQCSTNSGIQTTYDARDRVTQVSFPDGKSKTTSYLADNQVRITDEEQNQTLYTYRSYADPDDADDRLLMRVQAPEGIDQQLVRNELGQLTSASQGDITRTYAYTTSANTFLESEWNPETDTTSYGYDAVGNRTSRTIGGLTTTYAYDGLNRLTSTDYPGATPDVSIGYDEDGNRTSVSSTGANWTYGYDDNDSLDTETLVVNGFTYQAVYSRNNLDHVNSVTYPSGLMVDMAPDAFGRPTKYGTYVSYVSYYPNGQASSLTYGNGKQVATTQDVRQRPQNFTTSGVYNLTYSYDGVGNVTSIVDGIDSSRNRSFGYDGVNRLTSASGLWGSQSQITYLANGNINTKEIPGANISSYFYNQKNQLVNVSGTKSANFFYDVYGNLIRDTNNEYNYTFDDAGNLRQISSIYMVPATDNPIALDYDGNNMRVKRTANGISATYFFYSSAGQLLGEYKQTPAGLWSKEYIYQGTKMVAEKYVNPSNTAPTANAGPDQVLHIGDTVNLDGTASTDFGQGNVAEYQWRQISGASVNLGNSYSTATPSFDSTGLPVGGYTFQLIVMDNDGARSVDTVSITLLDPNNPDSDSDGLDDLWEIQHFGNLDQTAAGDYDFDGFTNLQEFQAGTDPTSGVTTGLSAVAQGPTDVELSWNSAPGVTYNIYWAQIPGVTKLNGTKIGNVTSPYLHTSLEFQKTYYYVVTTNQTNGVESAESSEVSVELNDISWLIPILNLLQE